MTLHDETRSIQKRLGSTPFPNDLQNIVDDANVMIARQAFMISQMEKKIGTARENALREALGVADDAIKKYAAATYSKKPVKVFKAGDDTHSQNAAKCYCAGEIYAGIEALSNKEPKP